ncbi:hypothetical protein C815_00582 [Firmicutes bacterium M10-2]|nr:hypothetical protein C815_00582 [Firmicutes bacterium M10-2]
MNRIRAEIFFLFQRKNKVCILIFILMTFALIVQKEMAYKNIRQSRMEDYQAQTELIQSNINFLLFEKESGEITQDQEALLSFWKQAYDLNYQVYCDWVNNEDLEIIAKDSLCFDELLEEALKKQYPIASYTSLLNTNQRDLKDRIVLAKHSIKKKNYNYLIPEQPDGYGLIRHLFVPSNYMIVVFLLFILFSNSDLWGKEFEHGMYKELFTAPISRIRLFMIRTGIVIGVNVFEYWIWLLIIFLVGTLLHGSGNGQLIMTENGVIQINKFVWEGIGIQTVYILFFSVFIQSVSWWIKDGIMVLMIGILCLMGIMIFSFSFTDIFSYVFCQEILYKGNSCFWLLIVCSLFLSGLTGINVQKSDLRGE